jgi:hypothetical protein
MKNILLKREVKKRVQYYAKGNNDCYRCKEQMAYKENEGN